jgi:SNF2 family DNA or RNA helicase
MSIIDTLPAGFWPAQVAGALRIQARERVVLADQPGGGKTLQALLAAELDGLLERRSNILILCNTTGCQLTWAGELQRRVASQYEVVIADLTDPEGRKTLPPLERRDAKLATMLLRAEDEALPLIVLANFEQLRWKHGEVPKVPTFWDIAWDMVAIDEAHLVLPTQEDRAAKMTQFWYGLGALKYAASPIKLPMTGTPDRGKLENRYGYWKWFWPESHRDFLAWVQSQFIVHWVERGYNPRTRRPNRVMEIGKLKHPSAWHAFDELHMIRRTKAEIFQGRMLDKLWANEGGVDLPMTFEQRQRYDDYQTLLEMQEMELIENGEESRAQALKLQYALRARQMATCTWDIEEYVDERDGLKHTRGKPIVAGPGSSNKLAWILEWLDERAYRQGEEFDASQGKVVIVSYFAEVLRWLQLELKNEDFHAEIIEGDTPAADKLRIQDEFQVGDLRIVLLSGFLGVSITLDAAGSRRWTRSTWQPSRSSTIAIARHATPTRGCAAWSSRAGC